jgi:hypothetical protein
VTIRIRLALQCGHLLSIERPPLRVGQQAVNAARDVPQVKRHRRQARGPRVDLFIRQAAAPALDILGRQFERMQHGSGHCRDFSISSAQPGFQ